VAALDSVSFAARAGAVTGLTGPNGAGKTTLFDTVSGMYRPISGRVRLAGRDITGLPPEPLHPLYRPRNVCAVADHLEHFPSRLARE
jgi:ABC-type branched-subunit amino acid transport system ATPase component